MGIINAMAHIVEQVQLITPGTADGQSYVCDADATGNVTPLEKVAGRHDRLFDLQRSVDSGPADDGESGLTQRRFRIDLDLRMSYAIQGDEARAERLALEDMGIIGRALASLSTGAAATTAGILSILPVSTSSLTKFTNDEAREVAWMWFVTFTLIYREV
jgi:hypothetical protein